MRKDWLAALLSFPSVVLEESIEFIKRIFKDEKDISEGAEYDPESEYKE